MLWNDTLIWSDESMWRESSETLPFAQPKTFALNSSLITQKSIEQPWIIKKTLMLAQFENTLSAGNFDNADLPINSWRIKRKATDEALFTTLGDVDVSVTEIYDFKPESGKDYVYRLFGLSNNIEGSGAEVTDIMTSWDGWILESDYVLPATPTTSWLFDAGIEETVQSSDITQKKGYQLKENFTQYPAFRFTNLNYSQFTITTFPYTVSGEDYINDIDTLSDLLSFLNNGTEKIMRNGFGSSWRVIITDVSYKHREKLDGQPFTITFTLTEVGSV